MPVRFRSRPVAWVPVLGAVLLPGCTATVLHDHILGRERRLTTEWVREVPTPLEPVALFAGVAADATLGAASIALWPVDLVGGATTVGWHTWQEGCGGAWWASPVLPVVTVVALPFAPFVAREGPIVVGRWFPPRPPEPADTTPSRDGDPVQ